MTSERDTAVVARLRELVEKWRFFEHNLRRQADGHKEATRLRDQADTCSARADELEALLSSPPPSPERQAFDAQEFERLRCDCTSPDFHQTGDAACAISRLLDEMRAGADHAE